MKGIIRTASSWNIFLVTLLLASCGGGGGGRVDESRTVQTTAAVIPATTKVFTNRSTATISAVAEDGSTLQITGTDQKIKAIAPGDTIVVGATPSTPSGFLRKVVNVQTADNGVLLTTGPGTIAGAIQSGSWSVHKTLQVGESVVAKRMLSGAKMNQSSSSNSFQVQLNSVLYDRDGDSSTTNDQIVATGTISIEPSFDFSGSVKWFQLKSLSFVNTTKVTSNISISSKTSITGFSGKVEVGKYYLPHVTIPVGGFPIEIDPVITVNVGAVGDVSVGISTGVEQTTQLSAGLSLDNGNWSLVKGHDESYNFTPPTVSAAATAKCYAGPDMELLIYGVSGPYVGVDGYLSLEANPANTPWWQLYGGIEATAGVKIDVFDIITASYSTNLFDYKKLLAQADGAYVQQTYTLSGNVTAGGSALPGTTVTLSGDASASTVTDASGNYSFTVKNGNYSVAASKTGYTMTPLGQSVNVNGGNQVGKNFTAQSSNASTYTINGTIHSGLPSGPVLAGASVSIGEKVSTSDAYGNFSITGIPAGTYLLTISMSGYNNAQFSTFNVVSDRSGLTFYLTQASTYSVSGTIFDGNNGIGLQPATVSIAGKTATTSNTGTFTIFGVPAGSYTLTVTAPGYNAYTNSSFTVQSNQSNVNITMYLAPPFGAQAANHSTCAIGVSWNYSTITQATSSALQSCGSGCTIMGVYGKGACSAYARGSSACGGAMGYDTISQAAAAALASCNARTTGCQIVQSVCNSQ